MTMKASRISQIHNALRALEKSANCAGYVVLDAAGAHVGTVRIKYPRDGVGPLKMLIADWTKERPKAPDGLADFTNWTPWQYGAANGCGYDKATAAAAGASIGVATLEDNGWCWDRQLRDAGYTVIQAI